MERTSATVVEELRRAWGGVRVDDVCAVDRALRIGSELNRSPVETASYVFASDPSLRRVAAGRRNLPGVFVDVLAGDSNEGVAVALLRAHADRVGDNRPELLLAVASMDMEEMLVSAAVAAGALWEEGPEGEDAENLERTLVLFAASNMSKVREAVGRVRGLPTSAFAALAHGSRRVRDNALAYAAMQPDVDADVLHLAAMWGNDLAKDEAIRHPNVTEDTLAMVARGDGPVGDNARRELERRRK